MRNICVFNQQFGLNHERHYCGDWGHLGMENPDVEIWLENLATWFILISLFLEGGQVGNNDEWWGALVPWLSWLDMCFQKMFPSGFVFILLFVFPFQWSLQWSTSGGPGMTWKKCRETAVLFHLCTTQPLDRNEPKRQLPTIVEWEAMSLLV